MIPHTPQARFARDVVVRLRAAGYEALWAGGCVRDIVLQQEPKDYDVATTAAPEEVRTLFGKKKTIPVGISFGVVIVLGPTGAGQIEVATFRREGEYLDGRRPESVEFCTPEEDAHRRDFTINGMFFDPVAEQVLDYVGGQEDLQRGLIRCIGNPLDRFNEDKLRMLRAVRFTARFNFQLEDATAAAIRDHSTGLLVVSIERITQELRSMLEHPRRARAVELAIELGLWRIIVPEMPLDSNDESLRMLDAIAIPRFEIALAVLCRALTPGQANDFCRRLKLSNEQREEIVWLVREQDSLADPQSPKLSRFKRLLAEPYCSGLIELTRVREQITRGTTFAADYCREYLDRTPRDVINPEPLLTGDDLISHGMPPGKEFKQILDKVRDAQLEEQIHSPDDAWQLVAELQQMQNDDTK